MKHLGYLVLVFAWTVTQLPANALAESVVNCQTIQSFTWPIKDPNGLMVSKTASISMDWPVSDTSVKIAKRRSVQAAWKSCRRNLGDQFRAHWSQLGSTLPLPLDEFRERRVPWMCEDSYNRPDLYTCALVER